MFQNTLAQIGLKPPEIETYTTLLKLGGQPASVIAKKLKVPRTTMRVYLEHLNKKGFVKVSWKGRVQIFNPEKPKQVLENLKQQKIESIEDMDQNMRAFSAVMPELSSLVGESRFLPKVTFYEGTNQLKQMYKDSLTSKTEILCLSSIEDLWDLFGKEYDAWYVKKRAKNQIPLRYIAHDSPAEREEIKKNKGHLRESKLLPKGLMDFSNEINIYDNKVSIITLKTEKIGLLIESKEIYQSMKSIFEALWMMSH